MKKMMVVLGIFISVMLHTTVYGAETRNVYILIDLSDSSPHITLQPFAIKSAAFIDQVISKLSLGSKIHLLTFGEYSREKNLISIHLSLMKKKGSRPKDVRVILKRLIINLPQLVKRGKLQLQKKTSLIAELKILGQRLDKSQPNTIIILSDLLEYSDDANAYRLITLKDAELPKPKADYLSDVDVIALGAGYGVKNSKQNDRLEFIWMKYFKQAGVGQFRYLTDF